MSTALAWLKRQRAVTPPPPDVERRDWSEVLAAVHRLRERRPARAAPMQSNDRLLPGEEISPSLWFFERHVTWPVFAPVLDLTALGMTCLDSTRLMFFDTETTGLAGGTGTRAFMIGLARPVAEGLRIKQYTLATMAAEPAMLQALLQELADAPTLVSYNGKSYDRPLLSTRLRLARLPDPLPALPHIDLLHPTRRRWKNILPNCKLSTVERECLSIVREDDLPGSEAPAAWLTFLRGGSAVNLRRVAEHNAQDLISLSALLLRYARPETPDEPVWASFAQA